MGIYKGAKAVLKSFPYAADDKARPISATSKSTSTKRSFAQFDPVRWLKEGFCGDDNIIGRVNAPNLKSVLTFCTRPKEFLRNKNRAVSKPKSKWPSDRIFLLSRKTSFNARSQANRQCVTWNQIRRISRVPLGKSSTVMVFANVFDREPHHRERSIDKTPGHWDSVTKTTVSNGRVLFSEENRVVLWNHPVSGVDDYTSSSIVSGFRICNHVRSEIIFPRIIIEMESLVQLSQRDPGKCLTYQLLSPFHTEILVQKPSYTSPTHKCLVCPTEYCFHIWAISSFRTADITKFIVTVTRYVDFGECESPTDWEWMVLTGQDAEDNMHRLTAQRSHLEAQRSIAERWSS